MNRSTALAMTLLAWGLVVGTPAHGQGTTVAVGDLVTLNSTADGFALSGSYPRNDFDLEFDVTCNEAGSIFDSIGLNAASDGAWNLVVASDLRLTFSLWNGRSWSYLTSKAKLTWGRRATVRLVREAGRARFIIDGKEDSALELPTALSGERVFVGDFKGDETLGSNFRIYQGILGAVTVRYFGMPRSGGVAASAPSLAATPAPPAARTSTGAPIDAAASRPPGRDASRSATTLVSQEVAPSNEDRVISWNDRVRVTIPGGVLTSRQTLTIAPLATVPPPAVRALVPLDGYDISLGNVHDFSRALTIELAYNPATLGTTLPADDALVAMSFDAEQGVWHDERFVVDTARKVVVIRTKHLSGRRLLVVNGTQGVVKTRHFRVYYTQGETGTMLRPPSTVVRNGQQRKLPSLSRPVAAADLARELATDLEHAWDRYSGAAFGFTMPLDTTEVGARMSVFVDSSAATAYRAKFSNTLYFPTTYNEAQYGDGSSQLRHESAHELFHAVQNAYLSLPSMLLRRWWMEATADYAADVIAWSGAGTMALVPATYFNDPITLRDDRHEYKTARLVDYLSAAAGGFKPLWDYVVAQSDNVPYFIDQHLTTRATSLDAQFRAFVAFVLFDKRGPLSPTLLTAQAEVPVLDNGLLKSPAVAKPDVLGPTVAEVRWQFPVIDAYTARVWGVRVQAAPGKPRRLKVYRSSAGDSDQPIDVYVLKNDVRPLGGARREGTITSRDRTLFLRPLDNNDVVYVVTANVGHSTGSIPVGLGDALTVDPPTATVMAHNSVALTTPGVTDKVLWRVQEGVRGGHVSETGVYNAGNDAGTYHVIATLDHDRTVTATATITVTPDARTGIHGSHVLSLGIEKKLRVTYEKPYPGLPPDTVTFPPSLDTRTYGDMSWDGNNFSFKRAQRTQSEVVTFDITGTVDPLGQTILSLKGSMTRRWDGDDGCEPGKPNLLGTWSLELVNVPFSKPWYSNYPNESAWMFELKDATSNVKAISTTSHYACHPQDNWKSVGWKDGSAGSLVIVFYKKHGQ